MGIFGFGKKEDVVDLGERYRRQQEKASEIANEIQESQPEVAPASPFPFFASDNSSTSSSTVESASDSAEINSALDPAERRRRLVRRLKNMTEKMEDLSSQIYRLQQRIEVLERKVGN